MKRYIDSEKLKAEIDRLNSLVPYGNKDRHDEGLHDAYKAVENVIDSLQPEQPEVDLEKEEFVGVAESPLKTFPRVNDFECEGGYRR